jgi:hypothetical protein
MKAQTQTLSIVLIAAIVIAMIGLAYAWGMPLIQKRTTITEFSAAQNFILNLDSKITEVANSGSGEFSLDIPNGFVRAIGYGFPDPENNSIILEFTTDQEMVINASSVLIRTASFEEVGTYGESEPRVIILSSESLGTGYNMRMRLHYRELDTETRGYIIALNPVTQTGNREIRVSFDRNLVQPGNASNGGELVLTYVSVKLT